jgi:hypothetical protein
VASLRLIRMLDKAPEEPVVVVDGHLDARGLELSHWPGNRTPAELKHELSTGIALRFAALPEAERERLCGGARIVLNNHYDTDGLLACFAVLHPQTALAHRELLLRAAGSGDMFRGQDERAFALDMLILGMAGHARYAHLKGHAKHERIANDLMEELPAILSADPLPYPELWSAALERLRMDKARIAAAARDDMVHLDLFVCTLEPGSDPGRHALFASTACDRALVLVQDPGGTRARLVVNTTSWFDVPGQRRQPRPDLPALCDRLNRLETGPYRWHSQPGASPTPELWCGEAGAELFAEHNACLRPSGIDPLRIKREVIDAVRAAWVFPGEDE